MWVFVGMGMEEGIGDLCCVIFRLTHACESTMLQLRDCLSILATKNLIPITPYRFMNELHKRSISSL